MKEIKKEKREEGFVESLEWIRGKNYCFVKREIENLRKLKKN